MLITGVRNDRRCSDTTWWKVGRATAVPHSMGTGIEKTFYENALVLGLRVAGLAVEWQAMVSVGYQGTGMNEMDLLVEDRLFIELEAAESIYDVRCVQCVCHLRTAGLPPAGRSVPADGACRCCVPHSAQGDAPYPMSDHLCHPWLEIGPRWDQASPARVFLRMNHRANRTSLGTVSGRFKRGS